MGEKPRELEKDQKTNFWAALDSDGNLLGTGDLSDAVKKAKEKGVADPIVWRVTEAYRHNSYGLEFKFPERGMAAPEITQSCPKCNVNIDPPQSSCPHCGHIILLNKFIKGE